MEIKNQVYKDYNKWINKIFCINNAYNEINKLNEFGFFDKSDYFYKRYEEIIKRNLNKGIQNFIKIILKMKLIQKI